MILSYLLGDWRPLILISTGSEVITAILVKYQQY